MNVLKKILKMFLPYGMIVLHRKYGDYKKRYKTNKNTEHIYDVIFSVGIACRPAHYLHKHGLRLSANPLDWMMSYSLHTAVHLYKTKFEDFFIDFIHDQQQPNRFFDVKNHIVSLHYPGLGDHNETFRNKMKNRFKKVNKQLLKANKICFLSHRTEEMSAFSDFLKHMSRIYTGNITLINIRHNKAMDETGCPVKHTQEKISDRLTIIEYEFNDMNGNNNNKEANPDSWLGNVQIWDRLTGTIFIKINFLSYVMNHVKNVF